MADDKVSYEKRTDILRKLFDPGYVGHRKYPGWSGFAPFYKVKCKTHGVVEAYPQGYGKVLRCPVCRRNLR